MRHAFALHGVVVGATLLALILAVVALSLPRWVVSELAFSTDMELNGQSLFVDAHIKVEAGLFHACAAETFNAGQFVHRKFRDCSDFKSGGACKLPGDSCSKYRTAQACSILSMIVSAFMIAFSLAAFTGRFRAMQHRLAMANLTLASLAMIFAAVTASAGADLQHALDETVGDLWRQAVNQTDINLPYRETTSENDVCYHLFVVVAVLHSSSMVLMATAVMLCYPGLFFVLPATMFVPGVTSEPTTATKGADVNNSVSSAAHNLSGNPGMGDISLMMVTSTALDMGRLTSTDAKYTECEEDQSNGIASFA